MGSSVAEHEFFVYVVCSRFFQLDKVSSGLWVLRTWHMVVLGQWSYSDPALTNQPMLRWSLSLREANRKMTRSGVESFK